MSNVLQRRRNVRDVLEPQIRVAFKALQNGSVPFDIESRHKISRQMFVR